MNQGRIDPPLMTAAQLQSELSRCEYCEDKPCRQACPAGCSAADFIMAARGGQRSDIKRAAGLIMANNPLGGVCGLVCPDRFCMAACARKRFDGAINIPLVQATLVAEARRLGGIPAFARPAPEGRKVAVVGGGPAGLAAAATLAQHGLAVDVLEASDRLGGMCNLIPEHRIDRSMLAADVDFVRSLGAVTVKTGVSVAEPGSLLERGYVAVLVAAGLTEPIRLGIANEALAMTMPDCLAGAAGKRFSGRVAVVGGGATAVDCAVTARRDGASAVELFALETLAELPLTDRERAELVSADIEVNGRTRVTAIRARDGVVTGIETRKVRLPDGTKFSPRAVQDLAGTEATRPDVTTVIVAIGMRGARPPSERPGLFLAGDLVNGPTTVVEAVGAGKNAARQIIAWLDHAPAPVIEKSTRSTHVLGGFAPVPVSLATEFFGRPIRSPYLLSAAPPTDGYEQMVKAYEAGWAGGVMKTAFDNVPIHIPAAYMHAFGPRTYGNCDNVSGHGLDRVCREVEQLVRRYPDRLTIGSTGGPVTGRDESDCRGWQSNTRKLDAAGAMGVEYSLSCPQGGDGTEGDIVSQNAALTAKIIGWIMEVSSPTVPKLFKLTAAVTSIVPIIRAIREVLDRYPSKPAGITLANTFPTLFFRPGSKQSWEEGIVVGMSGEGVTPISYLTLASAVPLGVVISGNGGPMDYRAAMNFLALGVRTVQFCTIVMKYGYGILGELESGTAHLMRERGIESMSALIGRAQPRSITDFMALPSTKRISQHDHEKCLSCGNCTRCPYLAIGAGDDGKLRTDPGRCIGCSICAQKCFTGAITMRDRSAPELAALKEA
jgi:NADPH-dependent glutamate synthase beta subunit-like oxidoreductase/dihydroorotate dehydrogenase/Pyruvate/2-oxoacid:ferredoxin oxidoreductase delta subunit